MNNNIRTMEFIEVDFWGRPVYKCIETNRLYKDITCGSEQPELCSCGNSFDGEPDCPLKKELEIRYKTKYEKNPNSFNYQLLDRLRSDCEYYLKNGNKCKKYLWANDEKEQIEKMKELYNSLNQKPEWLTYEQILVYEKLMVV